MSPETEVEELAVDDEGWPIAAVLECRVCGAADVLKVCRVLVSGGGREVYGFFAGCRAPASCRKEAQRRELDDRTAPRTDSSGAIVRIRVSSHP